MSHINIGKDVAKPLNKYQQLLNCRLLTIGGKINPYMFRPLFFICSQISLQLIRLSRSSINLLKFESALKFLQVVIYLNVYILPEAENVLVIKTFQIVLGSFDN